MKKLLQLLLPVLLLGMQANAQISFTQPEKEIADRVFTKLDPTVINFLYRQGIDKNKNWFQKVKDRKKWEKLIKDTINQIIKSAADERKTVIMGNSTVNLDTAIKAINDKEDTLLNAYKKKINSLAYWERYQRFEDKENNFFNFFPAYYGSQTKIFFESDTLQTRFFANNNINYNPRSKKMALYSETINDYFGPFRLDIGFLLRSNAKEDTSQTSNADTLKIIEKQSDLVTALQNGGGDISLNLKYPILYNVDKDILVNVKLYAFFNTGFALPVVNEATDKFYANYDGGMEGFIFINGFKKKINFFAQTKTAYYFGNRAFRKIIKNLNPADPSSFFMGQASFGLDFMDGFRLRFDYYYGNSFIRKNFPTSLTFIVRPKTDGNGKK